MVILSSSQSSPPGSFCPLGKEAIMVTVIWLVPGWSPHSNTMAFGGSGSSGMGSGVARPTNWLLIATKKRYWRCCCSKYAIRGMSCSLLWPGGRWAVMFCWENRGCAGISSRNLRSSGMVGWVRTRMFVMRASEASMRSVSDETQNN